MDLHLTKNFLQPRVFQLIIPHFIQSAASNRSSVRIMPLLQLAASHYRGRDLVGLIPIQQANSLIKTSLSHANLGQACKNGGQIAGSILLALLQCGLQIALRLLPVTDRIQQLSVPCPAPHIEIWAAVSLKKALAGTNPFYGLFKFSTVCTAVHHVAAGKHDGGHVLYVTGQSCGHGLIEQLDAFRDLSLTHTGVSELAQGAELHIDIFGRGCAFKCLPRSRFNLIRISENLRPC